MTTDVNEFLMSAGVASAKFEAIGDDVKGVIEATEIRSQTDIQTGEVLTWNDGNPRKQIVITLQTTQYDSDEDDGMRRVYVKGQMQGALREAVKKAGEHGIGVGGKLAVKYIADGEQKTRGFNAPKVYQVWYQAPPAEVLSVDDDSPLDDSDHPAEDPGYEPDESPFV